jgi:hypothetical protein
VGFGKKITIKLRYVRENREHIFTSPNNYGQVLSYVYKGLQFGDIKEDIMLDFVIGYKLLLV